MAYRNYTVVSRTTRLLYMFLPQNKIYSDSPERKGEEFKVILDNLCFRPAWTTEDHKQISKQAARMVCFYFIDREIDGVVIDDCCVFIDIDTEVRGDRTLKRQGSCPRRIKSSRPI